MFGSEQRGVWPNTSLLNFKHLSALVFGRFPLVKFLEESGVINCNLIWDGSDWGFMYIGFLEDLWHNY